MRILKALNFRVKGMNLSQDSLLIMKLQPGQRTFKKEGRTLCYRFLPQMGII